MPLDAWNRDRLVALERQIQMLQRQQHGKEDAQITAEDAEKERIQQQIDKLILQIRQKQEEYWQILAQEAQELPISETEAEPIVAEIVTEVGKLEQRATYPEEVLQLLREIQVKLNEPGPTAAAKLKGTISAIPPFFNLSYEGELDTENFLRTHFPTFTRLIRGAVKK